MFIFSVSEMKEKVKAKWFVCVKMKYEDVYVVLDAFKNWFWLLMVVFILMKIVIW